MRRLILASLIMVAMGLAVGAKSLELATPAAGVVALQGTVLVTEPGGAARACNPEEVLKQGWKLETKATSSADLLLWDKSTIRVSQNTTITLIDLTQTENGNFIRKIEVATGRIWVDAQKSPAGQDTFQVKGPQAVAAVKGTTFVVDADNPQEGTDIQVFEGSVECTALDGKAELVGADSEFLAPVVGPPRVARFARAQMLADDEWLARNWSSRQEMIAYLKKLPPGQRTVNLARMDPKVRAWLKAHFKKHPARFKAKARPIWMKPGGPGSGPRPRPNRPGNRLH